MAYARVQSTSQKGPAANRLPSIQRFQVGGPLCSSHFPGFPTHGHRGVLRRYLHCVVGYPGERLRLCHITLSRAGRCAGARFQFSESRVSKDLRPGWLADGARCRMPLCELLTCPVLSPGISLCSTTIALTKAIRKAPNGSTLHQVWFLSPLAGIRAGMPLEGLPRRKLSDKLLPNKFLAWAAP